jgi:16S rRNA processing protein RimM
MEYVYVGKIVNTHGIKGELRILSKFNYKEKAFKSGNAIYIGENHTEEIITSYRKHKMFDMVTLKNYNNINQVLGFVNEKVYIERKSLNLTDNEHLDEDIIGLKIISNEEIIGEVIDIYEVGKNNKLLETSINNKKVLVPFNKAFVKKVNIEAKTIEINIIEGLII